MVEEFFCGQEGRQPATEQHAQHPKGAEEVQRTGEITQQKADRKQIEKDAEGPSDAIVRNTALTVDVLDRNLADGGAMPRRQRGNEAMQLTIKRDLLDQFATISFKRGAEIVDINAAQLRHEPIGDARWNAPDHEVVDALLTPAAHDVVAFFQFFQEERDIVGIVLQVAIHRDDVLSPGIVESGS